MATDFFDRQDHARRQTRQLVVMFGLSVAAIIVAIYLVVAVGTERRRAGAPGSSLRCSRTGPASCRPRSTVNRVSGNPELFLGVAVGTLLVVGLGSLYKISELSAGGETVALMLGGQGRRSANHRSGRTAALERGRGNGPGLGHSRPAGLRAGQRTVASTPSPRGTSRATRWWPSPPARSAYLSREELQGVMGHEFSHILNGDMRLNLRLIGLVNGILVLAILGYYILRFSPASSARLGEEQRRPRPCLCSGWRWSSSAISACSSAT